jgi:hypothetical protein
MSSFREIPQYPGYLFGSDGSVWSRKKPGPGEGLTDTWHLMKGQPNRVSGYIQHAIRVNCKHLKRYGHRLILEAFVGPCPQGQEACHINGVKTDNRITNLRWDTRKENGADRARHGTAKGSNHGGSKLIESDIHEIRSLRKKGLTLQAIAEKYGVSFQMVSQIARGTNWNHVQLEDPEGVFARTKGKG